MPPESQSQSQCLETAGPASRLIGLPWEVRRPIIVEVLQRGRKSTPSFSRKFIESRVRVRNCFDEHLSDVTNFYVARHKNRYPCVLVEMFSLASTTQSQLYIDENVI